MNKSYLILLLGASLTLTSCNTTSNSQNIASALTKETATPTQETLIYENDLMNQEVQIKPVYSGSGEMIGGRAYIRYSKDSFKQITQAEFVEFVNKRISGLSNPKWFTIVFDDGTGIQFPGCIINYADYGTIDEDGIVTDIINTYTLSNDHYDGMGDLLADGSYSENASDTLETQEDVDPVGGETVEEENALSSAKRYLDLKAFSHDGLIDQLLYEGYSDSSAKYAADNCGADWNEQALKAAKSFLDIHAFSYSGLVDQLVYDKYTEEQAIYGTDNCGADWNEQAVKAAESFLEITSFSHSKLVNQLEYDGFTTEQAEYGVSKTGL